MWAAISVAVFIMLNSYPTAAQLELQYDFGILDQGKEYVHDFMLPNQTDSPVVISGVKLSCGGCLRVTTCLEGQTIRPHSEIPVRIVLSAHDPTQHFSKTVSVFVNGSPTLYAKMTLSGVIRGIWTSTSDINFGVLNRRESCKRRVFILASGYEEAAVSNVRLPVEYLDYSVKSNVYLLNDTDIHTAKGRVLCDLEIEWNGIARPVGAFSDCITVQTNIEECKTISIPVRGHVVGDVDIRPTILAFGVLHSGETKECHANFVWESSYGPFPPSITANSTDEAVCCKLSYKNSEKHNMVHVFCAITATVEQSTKIRGLLSLYWDKKKHVEIPYEALVLK